MKIIEQMIIKQRQYIDNNNNEIIYMQVIINQTHNGRGGGIKIKTGRHRRVFLHIIIIIKINKNYLDNIPAPFKPFMGLIGFLFERVISKVCVLAATFLQLLFSP